MTVYELNKNELMELKQNYYFKSHSVCTFGELASIDSLVTDKEVFEEYRNVTFTKEDFFCNSNNEIEKEESCKVSKKKLRKTKKEEEEEEREYEI